MNKYTSELKRLEQRLNSLQGSLRFIVTFGENCEGGWFDGATGTWYKAGEPPPKADLTVRSNWRVLVNEDTAP